MTIPNTTTASRYTATGSDSTYAYSFKIQDDDDIQVIVTSAGGTDTTLTKNTNYTVSGVGASSGSITLLGAYAPLTSGLKLTIRLKPELNNQSSFRDAGRNSASNYEDAFDRMSQRIIRLQDEVDRCIKLPVSEAGGSGTVLPIASSRAGGSFGFDADGNPSVSGDFDGSASPSVTTLTVTSTVTFSGLTASRIVATNGSSELTSISDLSTYVIGTSNQINSTGASGATTLSLSSTMVLPGTLTASSLVTLSGTYTDTSSNRNSMLVSPTWAPTTGTANFRGVAITPTFNSTGGSGRASAIHLDATITDAFSGHMAALSIGPTLSGGSTGANGGIWIYQVDNGTTTWEALRILSRSATPAYVISSEAQNGTARAVRLMVGGSDGNGGTDASLNSTAFYSASGADLGETGNRWGHAWFASNKTIYTGRGLYNTVCYGFDWSTSQGFYFREPMRGIVASINGTGLATFSTVTGGDGMLVGTTNVIGWLNDSADAGTSVAVGLWMYGTDQLIQRRSTNAQNFYVANTYTSGTNLEAGVFGWAGSVLKVGTFKGSGGGSARAMALVTDDTARVTLAADGTTLTFADALNIVVNTSTGTKIGTATTQKLSVYNQTPIVQGSAVADASGGATVDAEARTAINTLLARIRAFGIIAT